MRPSLTISVISPRRDSVADCTPGKASRRSSNRPTLRSTEEQPSVQIHETSTLAVALNGLRMTAAAAGINPEEDKVLLVEAEVLGVEVSEGARKQPRHRDQHQRRRHLSCDQAFGQPQAALAVDGRCEAAFERRDQR
jgi:hypothetical protein